MIFMDTLINFAKENFQLINLLVGVLGVLIALIAVIYELKARKHKNRQKDKPEEWPLASMWAPHEQLITEK